MIKRTVNPVFASAKCLSVVFMIVSWLWACDHWYSMHVIWKIEKQGQGSFGWGYELCTLTGAYQVGGIYNYWHTHCVCTATALPTAAHIHDHRNNVMDFQNHVNNALLSLIYPDWIYHEYARRSTKAKTDYRHTDRWYGHRSTADRRIYGHEIKTYIVIYRVYKKICTPIHTWIKIPLCFHLGRIHYLHVPNRGGIFKLNFDALKVSPFSTLAHRKLAPSLSSPAPLKVLTVMQNKKKVHTHIFSIGDF